MAEPIETLRAVLRKEIQSLHKICDTLVEAAVEYEDHPGQAALCVEGTVERLQKSAFHLTVSVAEFNYRSRSEVDGVSGDG